MIYISVKIIIYNKIDIIHCRCYPGIFIGVVVKVLTFFVGPRLLFDIRDFWLDSRIDTRKNKFIYRFLKLFEKFIYRISDGYVILTENAKSIFKENMVFLRMVKSQLLLFLVALTLSILIQKE